LKTKFDQVHLLRSTAVYHKNVGVSVEESVKIFLHEFQFFERGIFLSPSILVSTQLRPISWRFNGINSDCVGIIGLQVLKDADFLFESLFDSPVPHLAWCGGINDASKVDLRAPLSAILPSPAFADIFKGTTTTDNDACTFQELEALVSKAKRLFSYYGLDMTNTERRQLES